jgi:hypothetical protein
VGHGLEPAAAADVEDLPLPAQHGRDDAGFAGEPAGLGRGDAAAVVEDAAPPGPRAFWSWSRVMVTTTVAETPPVWGRRSVG